MLCFISRPNGVQKNILIADTILAEPGPQPVFEVWRDKIDFYGERYLIIYVWNKFF